MGDSALSVQVGGDHYKDCAIQPVRFIEANNLKFLEGCVVKRVTRHDKPTGKGRQDIEKAIHELQLLLELRYPLVDVGVRNGVSADLTIAESGDLSPARPAWPDDKAYRWMAQDLNGPWYAYDQPPRVGHIVWLRNGSGGWIYVGLDRPNPNWRDTLIERGADE